MSQQQIERRILNIIRHIELDQIYNTMILDQFTIYELHKIQSIIGDSTYNLLIILYLSSSLSSSRSSISYRFYDNKGNTTDYYGKFSIQPELEEFLKLKLL